MLRLRGMEEEGRCARRSERGGDLLEDQTALSHPRAHHAAGAGLKEGHGAVEAFVELGEQAADGGRLGLQNLAGHVTRGSHTTAFRTAITDRNSASARAGSSCTARSERA